MNVLRAMAVALACLAFAPSSAVADPVVTATAGFTINPAITGLHIEPGGSTDFAGVPIPAFEGSLRYRHVELYAEGIPALVPIISTGTLGTLTTKLGYLFGTFRYYLDGKHVSLGIGETTYHQVTTRKPYDERDTSDIAGLRYELRGVEVVGKSTLSLALEATPVMRGGVLVASTVGGGFAGERAAQIETRFRDVYPIASHVEVVSGLRYLNFAAAYVTDASLADRNRGLLATVGVLAHFGR